MFHASATPILILTSLTACVQSKPAPQTMSRDVPIAEQMRTAKDIASVAATLGISGEYRLDLVLTLNHCV